MFYHDFSGVRYPVIDKAQAILAHLPGVSRETLDDLSQYVDLLMHWQMRINLISPTTLSDVWMRHIVDSAQLYALEPQAKLWLDIGSGAGLPGLVLAILLRRNPGARVHLVESNSKKAAFLQHVLTKLCLPAELHVNRIESALPHLSQIDVVTARAFTNLTHLIEICNPLLIKGAVALFPKGRDVESELTNASKSWQVKYKVFPSLTDQAACILRLEACERLLHPEGKKG